MKYSWSIIHSIISFLQDAVQSSLEKVYAWELDYPGHKHMKKRNIRIHVFCARSNLYPWQQLYVPSMLQSF